jgi:hypothetical protein
VPVSSAGTALHAERLHAEAGAHLVEPSAARVEVLEPFHRDVCHAFELLSVACAARPLG